MCDARFFPRYQLLTDRSGMKQHLVVVVVVGGHQGVQLPDGHTLSVSVVTAPIKGGNWTDNFVIERIKHGS